MSKINIQFTLFSAFYSPLISTMTGGFLKDEGLDYEWSVAEPGVTAITALDNGSADVVQSTLSQGFNTLNKGETPTCVHFAQINEMDGFFITGRDAEPDFSWSGRRISPCHFGAKPHTSSGLNRIISIHFEAMALMAWRATVVSLLLSIEHETGKGWVGYRSVFPAKD